jgi:hypothetical protein
VKDRGLHGFFPIHAVANWDSHAGGGPTTLGIESRFVVDDSGRPALRFGNHQMSRALTIVKRPIDCYVIRPGGQGFGQRVSRHRTYGGTPGRCELDYDGDPPHTAGLAR